MLVKNWMTCDVVTITPTDSLEKALQLFKAYAIHTLPVVTDKRLEGFICDSDIESTALDRSTGIGLPAVPDFIRPKNVSELMASDFITVWDNDTVEETAALFVEDDIHGAPVLDHDENMVGIVTRSDLLQALVSLTGARRKGILFAFYIQDRSGAIKGVIDTIRDFGGRIVSVLSTDEDAPEGMQKIYIRMIGIDRFRLRPLREKLEEKASLLYMIDRNEIMDHSGWSAEP